MTAAEPRKRRMRSRATIMQPYLWCCLLLVLVVSHGDGFSTNVIRALGSNSRLVSSSSGVTQVPTHQHAPCPQSRSQPTTTCCNLVSEEDVLEAVERAEKLWAQALEARKTANALSDRAEEEAEAAASSSQEVDTLFKTQRKNSVPITMQQLAQADAAAKSNLDAGSMVNRALAAVEEADRLETLAEEALQQSEAKLEQHLKDFPDSSLAQ